MADQVYPQFQQLTFGICAKSASAEIGVAPYWSVVPSVSLDNSSGAIELRSYFTTPSHDQSHGYAMTRISTRGNVAGGFGVKSGLFNWVFGMAHNVVDDETKPFVGLSINLFSC